MKTLLVPMIVGTVIVAGALVCKLAVGARWSAFHQRVVAVATFAFGVYLATLTGTATQFVLPGFGAIGLGAAAGSAIGFGTFLMIGVVGVATGGVGLAIGAGAMTLIGAGVGAAGGAAGGFGFRVISYPLVSWWIWAPLLMLGVYLFVAAKRKKREVLPPAACTDAAD
ncbi:hypothetical protein ACSFA0_13010 [Variovorax sp. LT1P1]|uniref:hypothetical protein n=1 Tax=Variovorax sp. LT1P1 TaxID=3443730 RepID=UPI003F4662B6